jgi:voltage-gated potassium channel
VDPRYQRIRRDLILALLLFVGVMFVGVMGYHLLEGWVFIDAIYMTVITLAGVGYGETHPLSWKGRIFTIGLILMGLLSVAYILNRFTDAFIQGYFEERLRVRRQNRLLRKLRNHYLLCGYGRMGRQIAQELAAEGVPFIIIDPQSEPIAEAQHLGYATYQGDATLDQSLQAVGIQHACCLIAAMPSDAENLYAILSAKTLNPSIRAIGRATSEEAIQKLTRVGADKVISPYITGGKRMAAAALRPKVMDFLDGAITGSDRSFYMEEFLLDGPSCPYLGKTLRNAHLRITTGTLILAIRRADGEFLVGPMGETVLEQGDMLICMGTEEQLRQLSQLLLPI